MGKLLLFVIGVMVGAGGVFMLFQNGTLQVSGASTAVAVESPAAVPASTSTLATPPTNGIVPPAIEPPPISSQLAGADVGSLGAPTPLRPEATSGEPTAEQAPDAISAEGAAAVTAAAAASAQRLLLPVQGLKSTQLVDTYTQSRGEGRLHDAIDIMAARGTPVLAVADGRVAKLFDSKRGGLTVYQFDREEKLAYYYAHLDGYAPGLTEGKTLKRGEVLGFVGSTGNANAAAPHLHFAVFVLGPEKHWWQGTAVNPYPLLGGR